MQIEEARGRRVVIHAALADPHRLAMVDELALSDRSPSDLGSALAMGSNLLAHHLAVLEAAGLVERVASAGDGRRRYVRLVPDAFSALAAPVATLLARRVLFVCSANSARSQLAAAVWNARHEIPASSAGTRPAGKVRPEAIEAGARAGLDLRKASPRSLDEITTWPELVVTVCDVAREEIGPLPPAVHHLHWCVPDPARIGTPRAFDDALTRITSRVDTLGPRVRSSRRPSSTHPPRRSHL